MRLDACLTHSIACRKTIDVTRLEQCEKCNNSGVQAGTKATTCGACGGAGQVATAMQVLFTTHQSFKADLTSNELASILDTEIKTVLTAVLHMLQSSLLPLHRACRGGCCLAAALQVLAAAQVLGGMLFITLSLGSSWPELVKRPLPLLPADIQAWNADTSGSVPADPDLRAL